jgi:hypothetical protein
MTPPASARTRCAIVGTGSRATMYVDAILGAHAGHAEHRAHVIERGPAGAGPGDAGAGPPQSIRLWPMFSPPADVEIPVGGPHAGDALMLEQLFDPGAPPDPDGRAASHLDGAAAVLPGTAANRSIATGAPVALDQLHATL